VNDGKTSARSDGGAASDAKVWGRGNGDVSRGMSLREVVIMSGGGGSLTLGERMHQALEGDTTFFPAAQVSGKSGIDDKTAGCGQGDSGMGATTVAALSTGARIARGA
jgi:hypothetical protein